MGLIYALLASLTWGLVVPVHFRLLKELPPGSVLAHRVVWSALFVCVLLLVLRKRLRSPLPLRPRHGLLAVSATLIATNWLLYVIAVANNRILDASLGYFITPLVGVALGRLVLGERLRPVQAAAVGIVVLGVVLAVVMAGRLPVLSLGIAVSFAFYGLVRKVVGIDAMLGFAGETFVLLLPALGYIAFAPGMEPPPDGHLLVLLALTGATTALPLIWYAAAAQRLTLASLGLVQYVAPTCLMLLSVFVFGETLTLDRIVLFSLIWLALVLYAGDSFRAARAAQRSRAK